MTTHAGSFCMKCQKPFLPCLLTTCKHQACWNCITGDLTTPFCLNYICPQEGCGKTIQHVHTLSNNESINYDFQVYGLKYFLKNESLLNPNNQWPIAKPWTWCYNTKDDSHLYKIESNGQLPSHTRVLHELTDNLGRKKNLIVLESIYYDVWTTTSGSSDPTTITTTILHSNDVDSEPFYKQSIRTHIITIDNHKYTSIRIRCMGDLCHLYPDSSIPSDHLEHYYLYNPREINMASIAYNESKDIHLTQKIDCDIYIEKCLIRGEYK